ncbi:hypothetical protein AB0E67_32195 [Streptomyces sp. NPDC032161]|uniref:hypothetical protein n=1 Tax=unclassified Streptomyces TaxID=2593676 RepID=UPI0033F338DF
MTTAGLTKTRTRTPDASPAPVGARGTSGPPFWTTRRRDVLAGYLFIAPQLVGVALFVLIPVGPAIWYSLNDWNVFTGGQTFVGVDNYAALADDPNCRRCWGRPPSSAAGS